MPSAVSKALVLPADAEPPLHALGSGWGAILCDLDGCLISGEHILPGAKALLAAAADRVWIVSNNSTETARALARRLRRIGLRLSPDWLVLAGEEALAALALTSPGARVALHAGPQMARHARALGLEPVRDRPDVVLLARDRRFDFPNLERIVEQLVQGAELIATNADGAHPGSGGVPAPETGALLAAVLAVLPGHPHRVVGKPGSLLFETALARARVSPDRALMVGDNPATDGLGAQRMGIAYARVFPQTGIAPLLGPVPC